MALTEFVFDCVCHTDRNCGIVRIGHRSMHILLRLPPYPLQLSAHLQVYLKGFTEGVLTVGPHAGKKVCHQLPETETFQ